METLNVCKEPNFKRSDCVKKGFFTLRMPHSFQGVLKYKKKKKNLVPWKFNHICENISNSKWAIKHIYEVYMMGTGIKVKVTITANLLICYTVSKVNGIIRLEATG